MEKLYFIFVIILGSVLYNVAEVSTQPEWDNQQFLNNMPGLFDSYQQQSASANQNGNGVGDQTAVNPINQVVSGVAQGLVPSRGNNTNSFDMTEMMQYFNATYGFPTNGNGVGNQTAVNPIDQLVSDMAQVFVPSRDNKTNSYDLTEAMQYFNASYGFPTVGGNNRTHNGSDDEVAAFAAMFNAAASALLKPESIPNYLNLLQNASVNPSVAGGDNITSDALSKQFEREYEVYVSRFTEALHSNKTNDTSGVSQNHINDVVSNINNQLTQMLQWPNNGN